MVAWTRQPAQWSVLTNQANALNVQLTDESVLYSGHFNSNLSIDNFTVHSNASSMDIFAGKMNSNGGWDYLVSFGSDSDSEEIIDIAPAEDGGAYLLIEYSDIININGTEFISDEQDCWGCYTSSLGSQNIMVIKLNSNGDVNWTIQFGTGQRDNAYSIASDEHGYIHILASRWSSGYGFADHANTQYNYFWNSDGTYSGSGADPESYGSIESISYTHDGFYSGKTMLWRAAQDSELCQNGNNHNYCLAPEQVISKSGLHYLVGFSGTYFHDLPYGANYFITTNAGFGTSSLVLTSDEAELLVFDDQLFVSAEGDSVFAGEWACCTSPGNDDYYSIRHNLSGNRLIGISGGDWTNDTVNLGSNSPMGRTADGALILSDEEGNLFLLANSSATLTHAGNLTAIQGTSEIIPLSGASAFSYHNTADLDNDGVEEQYLVFGSFLFDEDEDMDDDGIIDVNDNCNSGGIGWQSDNASDYDSDGCQDINEDSDDDDDGVPDISDACSGGDLGWTSNTSTDYDSDGCRDAAEDTDDDNDSVTDSVDACSTGDLDWISNNTTDHDTDGCQDSLEDLDDDDDGVIDSIDSCPTGDLSWTSNTSTDYDSDGCRDAAEDTDDDNDGVPDTDDEFPLDETESIDTDADGTGDNADNDDDGDGFNDEEDDCPLETGNSTFHLTGCLDSDGDGWSDPLSSSPPSFGEMPSVCTYLNPSSYATSCSTQTNSVFSSIANTCVESIAWQPCNQEYEMEFNLSSAPVDGNVTYTVSRGSSYTQQNTNIHHYTYIKNFSSNNWDLVTHQNGLVNQFTLHLDFDENQVSQNNTVELKFNVQNSQTGQTGSIQFTINSIQFYGYDHGGDAFPTIKSQWLDSDYDGYGDNQSGLDPDSCRIVAGNSTADRFGCPDSDGDGWSDLNDEMPLDPTEHIDTDSDGIGDGADTDDDNDGVLDDSDDCPAGDLGWTSNSTTDYDSDGCQDTGRTPTTTMMAHLILKIHSRKMRQNKSIPTQTGSATMPIPTTTTTRWAMPQTPAPPATSNGYPTRRPTTTRTGARTAPRRTPTTTTTPFPTSQTPAPLATSDGRPTPPRTTTRTGVRTARRTPTTTTTPFPTSQTPAPLATSDGRPTPPRTTTRTGARTAPRRTPTTTTTRWAMPQTPAPLATSDGYQLDDRPRLGRVPGQLLGGHRRR